MLTTVIRPGISGAPATAASNSTPLTRSQLLKNVAETMRLFPSKTYKSLVDVEGGLQKLMAIKIGGTPLEQVASAAMDNGVKIGDPSVPVGDKTVGDLMRSDLKLTQGEINLLACHCANGPEMSTERAASNLDVLAAKAAG